VLDRWQAGQSSLRDSAIARTVTENAVIENTVIDDTVHETAAS